MVKWNLRSSYPVELFQLKNNLFVTICPIIVLIADQHGSLVETLICNSRNGGGQLVGLNQKVVHPLNVCYSLYTPLTWDNERQYELGTKSLTTQVDWPQTLVLGHQCHPSVFRKLIPLGRRKAGSTNATDWAIKSMQKAMSMSISWENCRPG